MLTQKNTFRHISESLKTSIMQNRGGQKVIERILVAYGFTSRQAFCNHLGISQSTMANRYARDTFPADWVIICSIETGASIDWLASGISCESSSVLLNDERLAHTKSDDLDRTNSIAQKFPIETSINPNKGGKAAIDRLVAAYGFSTRQALANHLQVSKSTVANRYLRDTFPSDWIIQCALETGTSLLWLTNGNGPKFIDNSSSVAQLKHQTIIDGKLHDEGYLAFDKTLIPSGLKKPIGVTAEGKTFIADTEYDDVSDGSWLIEIEGKVSLRKLTRIPVGKVKITSDTTDFVCKLEDITTIAKCCCVFSKEI
ncbi:TPA: phage repressor protein CI [Escherichia coli]|uniref:phage repressor protein CI n=1 Tax=Escherichia coli TaxID=562 RepID=UPI001AECBCD7|nr:phage repressor protein CI [Escherichia coli]MBP2794341.1 phage repressor protein CI [Escherichia coli]